MAGSGLGDRIAAYRRRRGLSQASLAGLVGRSESWLSQVERGVRSVDRMSVILDLARVLHVDADGLLGRPWQFAPNGSTTTQALGDLRAAFMNYKGLVGERETGPVELSALQAQVATAHRSYQSARYDDTIHALPALLASVEDFPGRTNGHRREALLAYVAAYVVAAKLVTKLGASDLAA